MAWFLCLDIHTYIVKCDQTIKLRTQTTYFYTQPLSVRSNQKCTAINTRTMMEKDRE